MAQHNLSALLYTGKGVPQNYMESGKWCRQAAEQGNTKAQYDLALMFARGRGVLQDNTLAYMWFSLAATAGHNDAAKERDSIAKKMTREQIAKAQELAAKWKPSKPKILIKDTRLNTALSTYSLQGQTKK